MKLQVVFVFLLLGCFGLKTVHGAVNGGTDCAACTLVLGLIEQLAQVHETSIESVVEELCNYFPTGIVQTACDIVIVQFGNDIIKAIYENETPDLACHSLGFCTNDTGEFCHLFPLPTRTMPTGNKWKRPVYWRTSNELSSICDIPGISLICQHINAFANNNMPLLDIDGDKFSDKLETFRGSHWRGKDCDDTSGNVYPGRMPHNGDKENDSNCNGIHGIDPDTGKTFEELFCNNTEPRGTVILGDSTAAHFHIPPEYFMAQTLDLVGETKPHIICTHKMFMQDTFEDLLMMLENEFDWPMLSSTTAFTYDEWPNSIVGPSNSFYKYMEERNLCNHRDYQNIGVNGARSGSMNDIVKTFARNQTRDRPAVVFLSLIGNDVCNGHPDTIAAMTTTTEYRKNMMVTLNYLDTVLPNNSYVFISGLADGRVLWDMLHARFHPIGVLNKDVTYQNLYDYLNCLQVSPCTGWMNSNATLRDITSERAANLSMVGDEITKTETFEHFKTYYVDFNIKEVIRRWEKMGGQGWQIIEPVDGFHPNQIAQSLTADYIWHNVSVEYPHILGDVNPNNHKIKEVFGDQGGY